MKGYLNPDIWDKKVRLACENRCPVCEQRRKLSTLNPESRCSVCGYEFPIDIMEDEEWVMQDGVKIASFMLMQEI